MTEYGGPVVSITMADPDPSEKDCPRCLQYKSFFQKKLASIRETFVHIGAVTMEKMAVATDVLKEFTTGILDNASDGVGESTIYEGFDIEFETATKVGDYAILNGVRPDKCDACGGSGNVEPNLNYEYDKCCLCDGTGYGISTNAIYVYDASVWADDMDFWADSVNVLTKELLEKSFELAQIQPKEKPLLLIGKAQEFQQTPKPKKITNLPLDPPVLIGSPKLMEKHFGKIVPDIAPSPYAGKTITKCQACGGSGHFKEKKGKKVSLCELCEGTGIITSS